MPILAAAAPDEPVADAQWLANECDAFSQAGKRLCLGENVQDSEKVLQHAENEVFEAMTRWDEYDMFIDEAKTRLVVSIKAFAEYRAVQCAYEASLSGGGNGRSITWPACVAGMNYVRAARLRDDAAHLRRMGKSLSDEERYGLPPEPLPSE